MSVVKAISGHAASEFNAFIRQHVAERGWSLAEFTRHTYGPKANSGLLYPILGGKVPLTDYMAEKWSMTLKIPKEKLLELNAPVAALRQDKREKTKRGKAAREGARIATMPPVTGDPRPTPAQAREVPSEDRFTLVINANGTAALRLNIPDLPIEAALKVMQTLELAELLQGHQRAALDAQDDGG